MTIEVTDAVERYSKARTAAEHERLLPLVAESFGADAAEFFDREGCLPLVKDGVPWPMTRSRARAYTKVVLAASVAGFIGAFIGLTVAAGAGPWAGPLGGLAVGFGLWFGIPALMALRPPADIAERNRLVSVFEGIVQKNRAAAEARAVQARMARLGAGQTDGVSRPSTHDVTAEQYARWMAAIYEPDLGWDNPSQYDLLDRETLTATATRLLGFLTSAGYTIRRMNAQDLADLDDLALDEFDIEEQGERA